MNPAGRLAAAALLFAGTAGAGPRIELSVGEARAASWPGALQQLRFACDWRRQGDALRCEHGDLRLRAPGAGRVTASVSAQIATDARWSVHLDASALLGAAWRLRAAGNGGHLSGHLSATGLDMDALWRLAAGLRHPLPGGWASGRGDLQLAFDRDPEREQLGLQLEMSLREASYAEPGGRYASDALQAHLQADARLTTRDSLAGSFRGRLQLPGGQAYAEPVFADFSAEPATLDVEGEVASGLRRIALRHFAIEQPGVVSLSGQALVQRGPAAWGLASARVDLREADLAPAFARYGAPFLTGGRWQDLQLHGRASGQLQLADGRPQQARLLLEDAGVDSASARLAAAGVSGGLHWAAAAPAPASELHWRSVQLAGLPLGAAALHFTAGGGELRLDQPLRLPVLDGALRVERLQLSHLDGSAPLGAEFEASIEPIDLASLCRALDWPEFGGSLSGRIPGVSLSGNQLELQGGLSAQAFDGEIRVDRLRLIEPFGRLPRLLAELRLRNLDLAAITSAFSFGRIDGRLSGDVEQLRLLAWRPVAMRARLYTPPGDRSRHRISQRAIDNISAAGGGPSGVLSRGALRFFDDFAYDRIGWSCVLVDGVCEMGGVEPAKNGGYVLVKGRGLPRIQVVGYQRRVDWDRFVAQLLAARASQGVEVR